MRVLSFHRCVDPFWHFTGAPEIIDHFLGRPRTKELADCQCFVWIYGFVIDARILIVRLIRVDAKSGLIGKRLLDVFAGELHNTVGSLPQSGVERAAVHVTFLA
jgi:hypothetical protein